MAKRGSGNTKDSQNNAAPLADIVLSIVNTLQITLDEKWASVSDMTDFQHLQDLTEASKPCQSYTKEVIAEMLVNDDAGILIYLFASSFAFRGYLASSCFSSISLLHISLQF